MVNPGLGKGFYRNGIKYEGEWKDGKQHGYGKEYYIDGSLRYEVNIKMAFGMERILITKTEQWPMMVNGVTIKKYGRMENT